MTPQGTSLIGQSAVTGDQAVIRAIVSAFWGLVAGLAMLGLDAWRR